MQELVLKGYVSNKLLSFPVNLNFTPELREVELHTPPLFSLEALSHFLAYNKDRQTIISIDDVPPAAENQMSTASVRLYENLPQINDILSDIEKFAHSSKHADKKCLGSYDHAQFYVVDPYELLMGPGNRLIHEKAYALKVVLR
ncbi:hypothetical protein Moror_8441 [Moniliophthora roreri MCA 2997]|uniref:Uncharacterized protein n=1 Tax=Moniliophthora roreri (strain MCA 2997) TaxID=1381753 RepID=V2W586_MONRO|nr:hypothetical protein Moror_8441 [Moniliophthora roreri MCA 2997]